MLYLSILFWKQGLLVLLLTRFSSKEKLQKFRCICNKFMQSWNLPKFSSYILSRDPIIIDYKCRKQCVWVFTTSLNPPIPHNLGFNSSLLFCSLTLELKAFHASFLNEIFITMFLSCLSQCLFITNTSRYAQMYSPCLQNISSIKTYQIQKKLAIDILKHVNETLGSLN